MDGEGEEIYSKVRQILGSFIGKTVADITQHDEDDFKEDGRSYVMLAFEDGTWIKFFIGDDGFVLDPGEVRA